MAWWIVFRQLFLEVFLGPFSIVNDRIVNDRIIPMSDAMSSEGPKTLNHPGNHLFILLPSGKRFRSMMAKTETEEELLPSGDQAPKLKLGLITFTYPVQPFLHILLAVCTFFLLFAHSSGTSLFILLFIKSTVYCIAHFNSLHILPLFFLLFLPIFIYIFSCVMFHFYFLHCPLRGPVLIYISLLIISCIIEYVTNKRTLITRCE